MNIRVIEISDKIARNEDVTMDEFKFLKWYIWKANKSKPGNPDDVLSNFVLDVRENYNPDMHEKQKEAWIYAHIKYAIIVQSRFDWWWMLYWPVPVSLTGFEMEWWVWPELEYQITLETQELDEILWMLHTPLERDIYINCMLGNSPVAHIAKEHWKSAQWWKIVKDRIGKKIKEYIENKDK